jgi:hypothetical protein
LKTAPPRIFFDCNGPVDEHGYYLWFDRSKSDLDDIPGGPQPGLRVVLYTGDGFEGEALLVFDPADGIWKGEPAGEFREV